jgi:hypothetical protein
MQAWRHLQGKISTMRFWTAQQLGHALLNLSILPARWRLKRLGRIKILVDTSALAVGVTHETTWVSLGLAPLWGDQFVDNGYLARVPVKGKPPRGAPKSQFRDYEDACYVSGIAHLARLGLIELRTSGELTVEQWRQPTGMFIGNTVFSKSVFEGIRMRPVGESPDMTFGQRRMGQPSLEEQQRERLRKMDDALYVGLVKRLGEKSTQDAWHIRTAETHGIFCFLTADYSLLRSLENQSKHEPIRSLKTKILSPAAMGKVLGLVPVDPRLLSHEGASFPVRSDLQMPGNKRRQKRR